MDVSKSIFKKTMNKIFKTKNPYITLTNPSTSREIIVTSYYNQDNSIAVALSGRGFTRDGRIKPSVATTGGIDVLTTKPGGGTTTITGSSAATAVLTGAVALILQWGIVEENNPVKINTMLISGTRKRSGDIYPNPVWGYGILDLSEVFKNIRYLDEDLNKT